MKLTILISIYLLTASHLFGQGRFDAYRTAEGAYFSADSIFLLIDRAAVQLDTSKADLQKLKELMDDKIYLADSVDNNIMKLFAYKQLKAIPKTQNPEEYINNLIQYGKLLDYLGNSDQAFAVNFDAISVADSIKNDSLLAQLYNSVGTAYKNQGNAELALKYLQQSLAINLNLGDSTSISKNYMSIGNSYKLYGEQDPEYYDTALNFYAKSLTLALRLNYLDGIAGNYNNIGNVYRHKGKFDASLDHFFHAVEINQQHNNQLWLSYNYNNIAGTYQDMGKYESALTYYQKSAKIKTDLGDHQGLHVTYTNMSDSYAALGQYKEAYEYDQLGKQLKAQLEVEERRRLSEELEARFENDRQLSEINKLKSEQDLQELVIQGQQKDLDYQENIRSKNRTLIYALAFILLSLLVILFFFWRNSQQRKIYTEALKVKNAKIKEVNAQIDRARENLALKNEEITDSISYAKRIQAAIMPSQKTFSGYLNNAFIYYLPKDIIAGDFYWTEKTGDTLLFAVADCTGHGVPGALVSIICHNALNSSINQLGLTDPGKILDSTCEIVIEQFEKSEENVNDGMDIALCAYDLKQHKLLFAGANMPLWLVRNNEVIRFNANRQPIGKHEHHVPFDTIEIPLEKGDTIYLSSDGFVDQFGGDRGKKYLNKRFRILLEQLANGAIDNQEKDLNQAFIDWKGEFEQVDDVCVMGVQF